MTPKSFDKTLQFIENGCRLEFILFGSYELNMGIISDIISELEDDKKWESEDLPILKESLIEKYMKNIYYRKTGNFQLSGMEKFFKNLTWKG